MDIKQKITKILEKANSTSSEAEAESLLAKAKRMMEEHQVSAFELGSDPFIEKTGNHFQAGTQAQLRYDVEAALAEYLGLRVVLSTFKRRPGERVPYAVYRFLGSESAQVTFEAMKGFVWDQVLRLVRGGVKRYDEQLVCWSERDKRLKRYQRDLLKNTVHAFIIRLQDLRERDEVSRPAGDTTNALVLIGGELDAFLGDRYPDLKDAKAKAMSPSEEAYRLALQVSLDLQVEEDREEVLQLT